MMKHTIRWTFLLIISFSLTSCIDIVEDIFLKKNGSGTYKLTLTISDNLRAMMQNTTESSPDDVKDESEELIPDLQKAGEEDLKKNFELLGEQIKAVKGVTNYTIFHNEKELEFGYSFDFDEVETLNKCMEIAAGSKLAEMPTAAVGKGKKKFTPTARYIELNGKTLIRHQSSELAKTMDMKKSNGSNAGMMGGFDVGYLFQDMKYTCNYSFEQAFKTQSNEAALVEANNKKLVLICHPFAPTPSDEKTAKLANEACSQAVVVSFK